MPKVRKMKCMNFILLFLFPTASIASSVVCNGWYQVKGGNIETIPMPIKGSTASQMTYSATYKGYVFSANWDFQLTTFYISLETNGSRILSTTARVPTENHPENFTDLNLPGGPRLSINCELK